MTTDDVRKKVSDIDRISSDDENAHAKEDQLYSDVLTYIAATAPDPWRELAAEALKTETIKFKRWCA